MTASLRLLMFGLSMTLVTAACGAASMRSPGTGSTVAPSMPVLAASAVPGLAYRTRVLGVSDLAKDASIPGLSARIAGLGFVDGRERTFQGESRHLTLVVSRFLVFKDAAGAGSYVALVHAESASFFGGAVGQQALMAQGRSGWLFRPPACACHLASPVLVGVVNAGSAVVWLEINGPDATPELLMSLLDPAETATA